MSTVSEAGLRMTVLPAASAAATPPQGIASGKFQGETTTTTPLPCGRDAGQFVKAIGAIGVEAAEVDRFGNFGVALGERLAALGEHRAHQIAAGGGKFVGHSIERCDALGDASVAASRRHRSRAASTARSMSASVA